jgi:hypothetical protein
MARKRDQRSTIPPSGLTQSAIAALKAELHGTPAPEGWYTPAQLAKMLEIPRCKAVRFAIAKKWNSARYMTTTDDGKRVLAKHYFVQ